MSNEIVPLRSWPVMLPLYMAELECSLGTPLHTLEEICSHFDISEYDIEVYKQQPAFRAEVRCAIIELKDSSALIRKKVKLQLQVFIDTVVPKIMADPDAPPAEKIKLIALYLKVAKIIDDPSEKAKAEADAAAKLPSTQPTINLIFTNTAPNQLNAGTPIIQEKEVKNAE